MQRSKRVIRDRKCLMSAKTSVRKMLVILTDLFSFILGQLIDLCVQNHSTLLCRFCYEFRYIGYIQRSHGLMDRGLDLKPEVTQGYWFKSRLRQEVSTPEVRPLCKAPIPQNCSLGAAQSAAHCSTWIG